MSDKLKKAINIAVECHSGQKDRAGEPYIQHPLRMMMKMKTAEEKITAVLHDVVEDSTITIYDLRKESFSEKILKAVDALTKRKGESYKKSIERVKKNPLAVKVKIADFEDNMDIRRLKRITENDRERLNRYLKYYREMKAITSLRRG
jgi:(p)ppGpp synthase/HD superfamily hydrolase